MNVIDVSSYQIIKSESSSKGNQRKFYNNGIWYKIDSRNCKEGLAEEFVSYFESCIEDFSFVEYKSVPIYYNEDLYKGCYSFNMYNNINIQFVSLRQIFRKYRIPLNTFIKNPNVSENIVNVIKIVKTYTGLDISDYLFKILLLDALIMNEDRHYMNLGVCTYGKKYLISPCFDNGSSLFCVNWTYRKKKTFEENIKSVSSVARPFSKFFDNQVIACIKLGARPLQINKQKFYTYILNYSNTLYNIEDVNLAKKVLLNRLNYYENQGVYEYV